MTSSTLYRSAATAIALQWSLRLIGLVSVLILARLLTPEDFGVIGLATAALTLVELLGAVGFRQALLRVGEPERAHYDTAFTIQLLLFWGMGLVALAVAPLVGFFYGNAALTAVTAALSVRFFLLGLVNIGVVDFDRHLEFGRDLRMRLSCRLASFTLTLAAAVWFRSYWALVAGLISYSALLAIASYLAHPYRPRLSLAKRTELLGTSLWIFLAALAQAVQTQIERLVLGLFSGTHLVGLFSVTKDLSLIFTQEIATALNRVTFVTVARSGEPLARDPGRMGRMVGAYAMVAAPLGLGLAATAEDSVAVLLGDQWTEAVPYLRVVAVYSALFAVYKVIASAMQAAGEARRAASMSAMGAAALAAIVAATALVRQDAMAVAFAALAGNILILVAGLAALARLAGASAPGLAAHAARPFAAGFGMWLAVRLAAPDTGVAVIDLVLGITVGTAGYPILLFGLWALCGRPAGAESEALSHLRGLISRRSRTV